MIFIAGKPKSDSEDELLDYKAKLIDLLKLHKEIHSHQVNSADIFEPKVVGFDLAGLEDYFNQYTQYGAMNIITNTRDEIYRLYEKGIFITIHCGETRPNPKLSNYKKNFWNKIVLQAIFHLKVNRLGHALNIFKSY